LNLKEQFFIPKFDNKDSKSSFNLGNIFFLEIDIFFDNSFKNNSFFLIDFSNSFISISISPDLFN